MPRRPARHCWKAPLSAFIEHGYGGVSIDAIAREGA